MAKARRLNMRRSITGAEERDEGQGLEALAGSTVHADGEGGCGEEQGDRAKDVETAFGFILPLVIFL
jgi:hypothetical protein